MLSNITENPSQYVIDKLMQTKGGCTGNLSSMWQDYDKRDKKITSLPLKVISKISSPPLKFTSKNGSPLNKLGPNTSQITTALWEFKGGQEEHVCRINSL